MNSRAAWIKLFTFLGGIYFFLEFVLPDTVFGFKVDTYHDAISDGFVAIGALAIGLGIVNILMLHGSTLVFVRKGWSNSLALLTGLFLMATACALDWRASSLNASRSEEFFKLRDFSKVLSERATSNPLAPAFHESIKMLQQQGANLIHTWSPQITALDLTIVPTQAPAFSLISHAKADYVGCASEIGALLQRLDAPSVLPSQLQTIAQKFGACGVSLREILSQYYNFTQTKLLYTFLYDGIFISLGSAMFALLGFYIASAAYRAFRIKSTESALMLGAALIVMLGQIPFGLWISESLPEIRLWVLQVPNAAAFRAVKFGAAVAGLVMAFRMWLSIESESFSKRGGVE